MTTWHNLPCPATLPAVSQLCPHGWVELEFIGGRSPRVRRLWGIDNRDTPTLNDAVFYAPQLVATLGDFTLIARMVHGAGPCNTCGRERAPDDSAWFCWPHWSDDGKGAPADACGGAFPLARYLEANWGVDGKPVYTLDEHVSLTGQQPAPRPGHGDMWAQVIARNDGILPEDFLRIFRERREFGIAKYAVPVQAGNGRDVCDDIVGETLDRIVYAEQAATERPEFADVMRGLQDADIIQLAGLLALYGRAGEGG